MSIQSVEGTILELHAEGFWLKQSSSGLDLFVACSVPAEFGLVGHKIQAAGAARKDAFKAELVRNLSTGKSWSALPERAPSLGMCLLGTVASAPGAVVMLCMAVPILNLFVGAYIGLALLGTSAKNGRLFLKVLGLAFLWLIVVPGVIVAWAALGNNPEAAKSALTAWALVVFPLSYPVLLGYAAYWDGAIEATRHQELASALGPFRTA